MTKMHSDFGPLPAVDDNYRLQQRSVARLTASLPPQLFVEPRDERATDFGVDLALEAVVNGGARNLRAQVLLKATGDDKLNADESFSLTVATSNLNYLLNGQTPIYIVWLAVRDELRYVWARGEAERLHRENADWQSQKSVTLRFRELLTPEAWVHIHDRVIAEGRLHRISHDALIRAATPGAVVFGVDVQTLEVTDPDRAYEILRSAGMALVTAGYASAVPGLSKLLTRDREAEPAVQLALGYAAYSLGEYHTARGHLGRALLKSSPLTPTDRFFLDTLLSECSYRFGQLSSQEYRAKQSRFETDAPPSIGAQIRVDRVLQQYVRERDEARRAEMLVELREAVARLMAVPEVEEAGQLQGQLALVYAESSEANRTFIDVVGRMAARMSAGYEARTESTVRDLHNAIRADDAASQLVNQLVAQAARIQNPLLYAEAILTRALIAMSSVLIRHPYISALGLPIRPVPDDLLDAIQSQLARAESVFQQVGQTEQTVRCQLSRAQLQEARGDLTSAHATARTALQTAHALGYAVYVEQAEGLLGGRSPYAVAHARITSPPDMDAEAANMTDEDIRRFARQSLAFLELPPDRLPVIERECTSHRDIAREKVAWCRHLELHQELAHQRSVLTLYARDPARAGFCLLHHYQSKVSSPDWVSILSAFKGAYCESCRDRSPKEV